MNVIKPHVSLNVSNIDASVAFYEKAFGVTVTKRRPGYAKFDLASPALNLTMQEAPRTGVNAAHFGVQVASTEDVAGAWSRFKEAGLTTFTEENTECCYALQDKVWVQDPDGNHWEIFVVKSEAATMGEGSKALTASACCTPNMAKAAETKAGGCCGPAKTDAGG
ncbi:MAG: ArsI/CadI family heavy metal resistance metalloenzyme [Polyangiaceae bacterium]